MKSEEFNAIVDKYILPHLAPESDTEGVILCNCHEGALTVQVRGNLNLVLNLLAELCKLVEDPLLIMEAVQVGLAQVEGIEVGVLGTTANDEAGRELINSIRAKLSADETVEWPDEVGINESSSER